MAEQQDAEINTKTVQSSFPSGRVKRIMKLDKEINKINSDALFVISNATELFVNFLAEKSSRVAIEKKRKMIKLEHLRIAVKRHQPTADFLLDSLPMPPPEQISSKTDRFKKTSEGDSNSVPAGSRRIDSFFKKGP
ncbi:DNA polymerase II subunit B3-1 [Rutidosis leptorrhynchoides]|uniref:DNA polymerase II subunit B3-1 n=1 Tax=Rutidosis leptorrhynchoides TaxID=125765 RepID=UPI003A9A34FE